MLVRARCKACQLCFGCTRVFLRLRKNVHGKRRARDRRLWFNDVQQNDLAAEPFRKSQCELKSLFGHWGKIDWHENFFEIQNCREAFYDLSGFNQLSFHLQRFLPAKRCLLSSDWRIVCISCDGLSGTLGPPILHSCSPAAHPTAKLSNIFSENRKACQAPCVCSDQTESLP